MGNILQNRTFKTHGWMDAKRVFEKYKSVVMTDYVNTTSSAGDWEGFLLQNIGKYHYLVMFSQSNNYPYHGYTVRTSEPLIRFDYKPERDVVLEHIEYLWQ